MKDMKPRNLRKRRVRAEKKRQAILKPAAIPKHYMACVGPALTPERIINRIIDTLTVKRMALAGMQYRERSKGVEIALADIAVLCMTEFGVPIDDNLLGDYR